MYWFVSYKQIVRITEYPFKPSITIDENLILKFLWKSGRKCFTELASHFVIVWYVCCSCCCCLLIQNATNDWMKSWLFLPALHRKSAKLFVRKLVTETRAFMIISICCMKPVHYSKSMLRKQDCIKFRGHIAWQNFFENNFVDFSM